MMRDTIKEKILILVKTYPTLSKKYYETVCTAGINKKGEWRRIYPIPFRTLPDIEKYKKYQWIEVEIHRNHSDPRPESYKLVNEDITLLFPVIDTKNNWKERKKLIFENTKVYNNLDEIISKTRNNKMSLCIFKPKKILDVVCKPAERTWNKETLENIQCKNEEDLFIKREIDIIPKLPYKFSYKFENINNTCSTLMIEDWEIGQLYWNCLKRKKNEEKAIDDVIKKYKDEFLQNKDIYLFLGTTKKSHICKHKNPYVIIGVFYPPKVKEEYNEFKLF